MRPTFLMSPVPAMPCTMLAKTSGAIIALIRCRKMSRPSVSHSSQPAFVAGGRLLIHQPTRQPTTNPRRICFVRLGWYQDRRDAPAGEWELAMGGSYE